MIQNRFLVIILFSILHGYLFSQSLSTEEQELYNIIMEYRKANGLPNIPLSKSLTFVAQTHVMDLQTNKVVNSTCNLHSWSDNGPWSPCCYTSDHAKASCMWNKPRELTDYDGNGYEISYGLYGATVSAEGALGGWKSSSPHNAVILNQGIWKNSKWKAIGVGISDGYAVVWFGVEKDNN